jgi:hypothetical protein
MNGVIVATILMIAFGLVLIGTATVSVLKGRSFALR